MKIKKLTATFGALDGAVLEPGEGLTVISAPNEAGKSTWAAFWRAMLYGIDTRDRDKKGYLADKNHYQPWSGAPMEGEITLEYGKRDITIRRGPRGNTPFGAFSAVYTKTQEPVPGLTASNCGELLTGVGQEVFTRSAFLGDGGLALSSVPELEQRIAALVTSGGEDVSFSQAMNRLKDWKNRRQVNKSVGEIPKLEGELSQVRSTLAELEGVSGEISRLEGDRADLERRRDTLSQQAQAHRLLAQKELSDRYARAAKEHQAAQEQYDALEQELSRFGDFPDREELKKAQGELQYIKVLDEEIKQNEAALKKAEEASAQAKEGAKDEHFPEMTGEEAVTKAAEISTAVQANTEELSRLKRRTLPLSIIFLLFAVLLGAGTYFVTQNILLSAVLAAAACAAVLLGVVLARFRVNAIKKRSAALLEPFGTDETAQLTALAQAYQERCQAAEKAAQEVETVQTALTDQRTKRDTTKQQLLDFVHTFAPEVKELFGCSAALSRALNLEHDLTLARERTEERRRRLEDLEAQGAKEETGEVPELPLPELGPEETDQALNSAAGRLTEINAQLNQLLGVRQGIGDPAALAARREELEDALGRRRLELDAIALAMDVLTQANAQLQERFSPELNRLTGEYMARLTGNKYAAVSLTRELEGFVREEGGVLPRGALWLSKGTADQLYLAVRLAVCRLTVPDAPIVLDDALAAFDDGRMELALALLKGLGKERQILLFSCHRREGEWAEAHGVPVIEL